MNNTQDFYFRSEHVKRRIILMLAVCYQKVWAYELTQQQYPLPRRWIFCFYDHKRSIRNIGDSVGGRVGGHNVVLINFEFTHNARQNAKHSLMG